MSRRASRRRGVGPALSVGIVAIGDELLSGFKVDTNSAWIGQRLAEIGVPVVHRSCAGDGVDQIAQAVGDALQRATAVIVTGGLGPTTDDRTREGIAQFAKVRCARDPRAEDLVRTRLASVGREVRASHLLQADLPQGSVALANAVGIAPGFKLSVKDAVIFSVPGPPREMQAVVEAGVVPELLRRRTSVTATRSMRTALVPETAVAAVVEPMLQAHPEVAVAYLPSPAEVVVRLSVVTDDERIGGTDAVAHLEEAAEEVREALGDVVVGDAAHSLEEAVVTLLANAGRTVAVAESLTGGLVAAAMTDVPGASQVLLGGVVSYSTDSKHALLGVERQLLAEHGAVHAGVAREMAEGVRERFGADFGLATTGVAGPGEQDGQPVGRVHVAIASATSEVDVTLDLFGDRAHIRRQSVVQALDLLRRTLLGLPPHRSG